MRVLVVVDVQNDFISGALGTDAARAATPAIKKKIEEFDGIIIATKDTHRDDYMKTFEGKRLPVKHCVIESNGWQFANEICSSFHGKKLNLFYKGSFGSIDAAEYLQVASATDPIESIEIIGVCTDICVVSNALLLRAYFKSVPIIVDAACCAGTTPERHRAALETMKSCMIDVINE